MTSVGQEQESLRITRDAWGRLRDAYVSMRAPGPTARLVVKGREFDGYWYDLYFVRSSAKTKGDALISGPDLSVILDKKSATLLKGAVLDSGPEGLWVDNPAPAWPSSSISTLLASSAGLRRHSEESKAAAQNKHRMRELLSKAGLLTPEFRRVSVNDNPHQICREIAYPSVIKPLALSASCGVMRVNDPNEFIQYFERLLKIMQRGDIIESLGELSQYVLIEGYIPGGEVAVEGLVLNGDLEVLAIFDKPDPLEGPFFEETIYVRPSQLPAEIGEGIIRTSRAVVTALGLSEGPVHIEARVNEQGVWPLDVGARIMGGQCSRALRFVHGRSWEEIVVQHTFGGRISSLALSDPASGVMMIPIPKRGVLVSVGGLDDALGIPLVADVCIATPCGHRVEPPPEGMDYLGFIFAYGDSPDPVTDALRRAHSSLRLDIDEGGASDSLRIEGRRRLAV